MHKKVTTHDNEDSLDDSLHDITNEIYAKEDSFEDPDVNLVINSINSIYSNNTVEGVANAPGRSADAALKRSAKAPLDFASLRKEIIN